MRGYTLIEIIVSIAIIGVMATAGYPKMVETVHQIRLEQHAHSIYEDFCLTRDTAIAAGKDVPAYSRMNFYHFNNDANNPMTSYEMLDQEGEPVKTALMKFCDEFDAVVANPRSIISSESICIVPDAAWEASTTAPLSRCILFDRNGTGWRRPIAGAPDDLEPLPVDTDLFLIRSLNLIAMLPNDDLGAWSIRIDADTGRPMLRRVP